MSFRGRELPGGPNASKIDLGEPRRFGGMGIDDKLMGADDNRRFDSGRGRRPFGRGRRSSPNRERPGGFGYGREDASMMRDRSPMRNSDNRFSDNFRRDDMDLKDPGRAPYYGSSERFPDSRPKSDESGGFGSHFDGPFKSRNMAYGNGSQTKPFFEGFPKPNECEIIAVSKQQRAYAESVEARIKNLGILVDVLFLKDEALLTQTVDDIARRGSLYAMVINPQNETHGSVTVNILHGTPQEHRNMPLEDALKLVARNFHEYVRGQRERMDRERAERGQYTGAVFADQEVQFLLRMLADGRWVSATEISAVIRYLTERRDKMALGGSGADDRGPRGPLAPPSIPVDLKRDVPFKPKEEIDVAQKEQDLQNRIMNLMNQGAPSATVASSSIDSAILTDSSMNSGRLSQAGGLGSNLRTPSIPGLKSSADLANQSSLVETSIPQSTYTSSTTTRADTISDTSSATAASTFINFDHSEVQKALDNLIQSGPNILASISNVNLPSSNTSQNSLAGVSSSNVAKTSAPGISSNLGGGPLGNANLRGPGMMGTQNRSPHKPSSGMGEYSGPRGPLTSIGDLSAQRGPPSGIGDYGGVRGMGPSGGMSASDMNMGGQQRTGYGGLSDNPGSNMNSMRGYGGGLSDSGGNPRMSDMGRMPSVGSMHNMGSGNASYPPQNQYGNYKGPSNQQNQFSNSSYNAPNMMRQNYGGQGMGGPRRY